MAREQMDKKALDFLDEYTNGVLDYIKHSLYGISISRGLLKVYKHVNYVSALSFCGSDDAGATIVIRVRASVKPKEVKTKETHHE
jgi:uncharacterized pyridoxamine 5'-phosphate oxidase family protein